MTRTKECKLYTRFSKVTKLTSFQIHSKIDRDVSASRLGNPTLQNKMRSNLTHFDNLKGRFKCGRTKNKTTRCAFPFFDLDAMEPLLQCSESMHVSWGSENMKTDPD